MIPTPDRTPFRRDDTFPTLALVRVRIRTFDYILCEKSFEADPKDGPPVFSLPLKISLQLVESMS